MANKETEKGKSPKGKEKRAQLGSKNSRKDSVEKIRRNDMIVSDRIAGMPVGKIAEKHGINRITVFKILKENDAKVVEGRNQFIADHQEAIYAKMNESATYIAEIAVKSARTLEKTLNKVEAFLDESPTPVPRDRNSMKTLIDSMNACSKALGTVSDVILKNQKESDSSGEA